MKDLGLSLREIRKYCQMAGDDEIQVAAIGGRALREDAAMAFCEEPPAMAPEAPMFLATRRVARHSVPPPASTAREESAAYRARARRMREEMQRAEAIASLQGHLAGSPPATLAALVREALGGQRVPRKARADLQHTIDITPEIGLVLRGDYTPEERAVFEELADVLREWLIGGGGGDPS